MVAGLIFVVLSYLGQLVFPSNQFGDVESGSLDLMMTAGGQFLQTFFTAAYVAGALGSAIASQASVARILYAMGRDGILPRSIFGYVSPRFATPVYAILTVSVVSLLATVISLTTLASVISFGALVAFSVVNLSVIKHYFRGPTGTRRRAGGRQPGSAVDRFPAHRVAVDQFVRTHTGHRIMLAGSRICAAGRGDPGFPAADSGAGPQGIVTPAEWPLATRDYAKGV